MPNQHTKQPVKSEFIRLRVDPKRKKQIQRLANRANMTLTDYVIWALKEAEESLYSAKGGPAKGGGE